MTRGTSIRKSLRDEVGAGETNRAMPFQSVVAVCEAEAAPRQRMCTSALLTGAPEAVAIVTAPAAFPSRRRAAMASAYRGCGGVNPLALEIAFEACTRPDPQFGFQPLELFPLELCAAVRCSRGRTASGATPLPIRAAAAALTWAVAGEVPANSHQLICAGAPRGKACARMPSQRPSWLTS